MNKFLLLIFLPAIAIAQAGQPNDDASAKSDSISVVEKSIEKKSVKNVKEDDKAPKPDAIPKVENKVDSLSVAETAARNLEKYDLQLQEDSLSICKNAERIKVLEDSIKPLKLELDRLIKSNEEAKIKCEDLKKKINQENRQLLIYASEWFYKLYDKEGVEKKAIPAWKAATDSGLKSRNIIRLKILENFESDIVEFYKFAKETDEKLSVLMSNNEDAKPCLLKIRKLECYKRYKEYHDGKSTWLGKKIFALEAMLSKFDGGKTGIDKITGDMERYVLD